MRRVQLRTAEEVAAALAAAKQPPDGKKASSAQVKLLLELEHSSFIDYREQYPLLVPGLDGRRRALVEPKWRPGPK